jgi:hypothetical protein
MASDKTDGCKCTCGNCKGDLNQSTVSSKSNASVTGTGSGDATAAAERKRKRKLGLRKEPEEEYFSMSLLGHIMKEEKH